MSLSNYFYESFNSSLTANLNALRNFSIKNNLSLNVGTLAINITNSFNVFFPFIELFNFTEFQNNFSWGIEHKLTDNVTLVNFAITMDEGQNETMYVWQFNESNTLNFTFSNYTYPIFYAESSTILSTNWAGYEFYVSQPNYINGVFTTINMPNTYVPWSQIAVVPWPTSYLYPFGVELSLSSWVGLSQGMGGIPYLAQTGYAILYYPSMPVGSAQLFYEIYPKNEAQYYPGSPTIVGGNIVSFEVDNLGNQGFEFTAYDQNTSKIYTLNYKMNSSQTYYAQFITEAVTAKNLAGQHYITQILEFKPSINMTYPLISVNYIWTPPSAVYKMSNNYYLYELTQSPNNININTYFGTITQGQYENYMTFTWNNSHYNYNYVNG
ncbi:MAG: hypothetical protein ACP5IB_05680 [Thermoplasmata archaeon]